MLCFRFFFFFRSSKGLSLLFQRWFVKLMLKLTVSEGQRNLDWNQKEMRWDVKKAGIWEAFRAENAMIWRHLHPTKA